MINLKEIKKYMLVLPNNIDRKNNATYIKNQYFPDLELKYVINSPFDKISMDCINNFDLINTIPIWGSKIGHYKNVYEFSCAYEHYRIIKEAYLLKYPYIFIMEDDISLNYNLDIINEFLLKCPDDFDMLKLGYWNHNIKTGEYEDFNYLYKDQKKYWIPSNEMMRYCTLANIYSYNGMKKYLDFQEKNYGPADLWTYFPNDDKKFISTISLFGTINTTTTIHI